MRAREPGTGPAGRTRVVVDTDIGTNVDDALALALALRHPELEVVAVTTVSGPVERRARVAARLAALADRPDVPVVAGAGDREGRARPGWVDGGLLADGDDGGPAAPGKTEDRAAEVIVGAARAGAGLVALGPLTNLADALGRDPGLPRVTPRLAVMGGVVRPGPPGVTAPGADDDTNLATEPAAALAVLTAGFPLLLVPLEVTTAQCWTRRHLDELAAGDGLCRALARMVASYAPWLARRLAARGLPGAAPDGDEVVAVLHDPLTVAATADPDLVTTEEVVLVVERRGRSVRTREVPAGTPGAVPARLVTGIAERSGTFADWLLATLRGPA